MNVERCRHPTKKQHYVTQKYLEGFAEGGTLAALRKSNGYCFATCPKDAAARRYFYEAKLRDATERDPPQERFVALNYIERQLSTVEGRCLAAIRSVCDVALGRKGADDDLFRNTDAVFAFAVQTAQRSPYALGELRETVKSAPGAMLAGRVSEICTNGDLPRDMEALIDEAANRFILLDRGMGRLTERIAERWRDCQKILAVAPTDAHFITSDFPVLAEGPEVGEPTVLYMPLSSRVGILFDRGHPTGNISRAEFTTTQVDGVNSHFLGAVAQCRYLYGGDRKYLLELYARARGKG